MGVRSLIPPPGFSEMSKTEQVRYLQALWDQIAESPGEISVPESHLEVAEARLKLAALPEDMTTTRKNKVLPTEHRTIIQYLKE